MKKQNSQNSCEHKTVTFFSLTHWIQMYKPQEEDHVVGVVLEARQDEYKVDVGAAATARLPALAFDGASKKNRPNLRRGDAVYARIALAQPGIELELTCAVPHGVQPKDWVTKEALFGEGVHAPGAPTLMLAVGVPKGSFRERVGHVRWEDDDSGDDVEDA